MFLRIESIPPKLLIGMCRRMTIADDQTFALWSSFMPRRREITGAVGPDLISMQIFERGLDVTAFSSETPVEKWAAVEVTDFTTIPAGMKTHILSGGVYAVFLYKGHPAAFGRMFNFIFREWLPASEYERDDREHFELLGAKYKNNSPDSEEEIWIPLRAKRY
jgi:AraC family transcriptional regulator